MSEQKAKGNGIFLAGESKWPWIDSSWKELNLEEICSWNQYNYIIMEVLHLILLSSYCAMLLANQFILLKLWLFNPLVPFWEQLKIVIAWRTFFTEKKRSDYSLEVDTHQGHAKLITQ